MKKILIILFIIYPLTLLSNDFNGKWVLVDSSKMIDRYGGIWETNYEDIDCYDPMNCMAVGNENEYMTMIKKTTDGGQTWKIVLMDSAWVSGLPRLFNLSYPRKDLCVVLMDSNYVLRTSDGGKSWKRIKFNANYHAGYYSQGITDLFPITLRENGVGYFNWDKNTIMKTTDSGKSWHKLVDSLPDSLANTYLGNLFSPEPDVLIFGAMNLSKFNHIVRTTNEGKTFEQMPSIPNYYQIEDGQKVVYTGISSIYFIDRNEGWFCGGKRINSRKSNVVIMHTTNGGRSWEIQLDTLDTWYGLRRIYFSDRNNGIASGYWNNIWRTTNGGKTWSPEKAELSEGGRISDLYFFSHRNIIAVTNHGYIYKYVPATSVSDNSENVLLISPNPATDYIEIATEGVILNGMQWSEESNSLFVYDVLGVCVLTHPLAPSREGESVRIDVSGLAAGVYFVRVGGRMYKFVKM